jgi:hypothetical protein
MPPTVQAAKYSGVKSSMPPLLTPTLLAALSMLNNMNSFAILL